MTLIVYECPTKIDLCFRTTRKKKAEMGVANGHSQWARKELLQAYRALCREPDVVFDGIMRRGYPLLSPALLPMILLHRQSIADLN